MRSGFCVSALCLLIAACSSSEQPATQIVVAITSDLMPVTELSRIQIEVSKRDGSDMVPKRDFMIVDKAPTKKQQTLPITFAVGKGTQGSFLLVVHGYGPSGSGGVEQKVVEQRVIATFQTGKTLLLQVFLGRVCLNRFCGDTGKQVCYAADRGSVKAGDCGDIPELGPGDLQVIDVHELPDLARLPKGVKLADAGATDAGMDASVADSGEPPEMVGSGGTPSMGSGGMGGSGGRPALDSGSTDSGGSSDAGSMPKDPCARLNGGCDALVDCHSSDGKVTCDPCPSGYDDVDDDGTKCTDVDECKQQTFDCKVNSMCSNTLGDYACPCDVGFHGDGKHECLANMLCNAGGTNCASLASCVDVSGTKYCVCNMGYAGDGVSCADVDECQTNNGGCGSSIYWKCDNNVGAAPTCTDIDECKTNNGSCGSATYWTCANTTGAGPTCTDIDECKTNNGGCDALTSCSNQQDATPTCGACPAGYLGDGDQGCSPTLTGLTLSAGTLSPALSTAVTAYSASIPLVRPTVTLTPSVPTGATVTIESQAVSSGQGWTSPVLALGPNTFTVVVSRSGRPDRTYTLTLTRGKQEAYVKASNTSQNDSFGYSVAISGDTMVVGAAFEDSVAQGVNGNQSNDLATDAGAAYVFVRNGSTWSQQAYLKASNTEANDNFGSDVAISGDTIVVGAYAESSNASGVNGNGADNSLASSGAAYVFARSGTIWSPQGYLKASNPGANDDFGYRVGVSGNTIVVSAPQEASNATGIGGNQADNSAAYSGAVYVFVRNGSTWSQQAYLKASNSEGNDQFGTGVAIDGNTIVAGSRYEASNATGVGGNQADNSLQGGAAYVFVRNGSTWSQQGYLKAGSPDVIDQFGVSVAVSGDTVVVGADLEDGSSAGVGGDQTDNGSTDSGAAYVFVRNGTTWSPQAYLKASNPGLGDYFGFRVAVSGDVIVVGSRTESGSGSGFTADPGDNSASSSGAAYVFVRTGTTWAAPLYIKGSNTEAGDYLGWDVAVSGDTIVLPAMWEDSSATGIGGSQSDNSLNGAGAVYVLR